MPSSKVYIIDANRSPFLKSQGIPGPFSASDLAVQTGASLLSRQDFFADQLDEVILGCVSPAANEANIARLVALRLGCGEHMPAWTVQRNCASGLQAIDAGIARIKSGQSQLVLVGGTEAMSHYPVQLNRLMLVWLSQWMRTSSLMGRLTKLTQLKAQHFAFIMSLLEGLHDPVVNLSMGQTAELLADYWHISRSDMDQFALVSHTNLAHAIDQNQLDEISPLYTSNGTTYCYDDGLRRHGNIQKLGQLKPVFDPPYGKVTAANSAQITDGAALLIIASQQAVEKFNLQPRAEIVDIHWAAIDPAQMGLGPIHAMSPIMQCHQLNTQDIDYWEINEAFAAQVLSCVKAWQAESWCRDTMQLQQAYSPIDCNRLNIDGGAISLGHPLGASGARIVLHLLHVLERKEAHRGMASLCIGGGQGGALLLQRGELQ